MQTKKVTWLHDEIGGKIVFIYFLWFSKIVFVPVPSVMGWEYNILVKEAIINLKK
jgi:hypothetical protein